MKILQKIKVLRRQEMRPLLKPAVLALVLGAAYGLGKCSGENNGERRLAEKDRQFAAKEQAYLRKIDDLSIKANPFRFYEIDGSGHEVAEFEKIRREPMPEEMRNRFGKYRMREISPEEIVRLDTLLERKGIELKDYEQKPERLQALSARLQDTIGVMGDESYLQDAAEYRRLMVAELCRFGAGQGTAVMIFGRLRCGMKIWLWKSGCARPSLTPSSGRRRIGMFMNTAATFCGLS